MVKFSNFKNGSDYLEATVEIDDVIKAKYQAIYDRKACTMSCDNSVCLYVYILGTRAFFFVEREIGKNETLLKDSFEVDVSI